MYESHHNIIIIVTKSFLVKRSQNIISDYLTKAGFAQIGSIDWGALTGGTDYLFVRVSLQRDINYYVSKETFDTTWLVPSGLDAVKSQCDLKVNIRVF